MKKLATPFSFVGLLISTSIWGSTFFIIKDTVASLDPVALVAYRFSLAAIIFAVIVFIRKEKFWQHAGHGFILGIFVWIIYLSQTLGLQFTTASNSGFISGLFIIFVPLFNFLLFGKKAKVTHLVALSVALIGLWFLTGGLRNITVGDLLTLLSAICISLNILFIDRFVKEKKSVAVLCFQQFSTTAFLSFLTALLFHSPLLITNTKAIFPVIFLAVFGSCVAQGVQLLSQRHLKTLTSSLLLSTEPVFAAVFAWTLGNELFVPAKAVGGIFILIAIFMSEIPIKKKKA